jgi:hypothetical protein
MGEKRSLTCIVRYGKQAPASQMPATDFQTAPAVITIATEIATETTTTINNQFKAW